MITKTPKITSENSKKPVIQRKNLNKSVKRTSIKNGRHVNPRPLSKRIFPFLPDTQQELFNHLARYYNRTQWLSLNVLLKEYRRLLRRHEKCDTFELTNKIIGDRMGLKGISMVPEYTNKNEDFGVVFKRYRCQDRNAYLPNIYRIHPCFEDPTFLNAFIKLIDDALRSNSLPRLLKHIGGVIISVNSVLISICKRGLGRLLEKKSTHSKKQIIREGQHRQENTEMGTLGAIPSSNVRNIPPSHAKQSLLDGEREGVPLKSDAIILSDEVSLQIPVRKLRIDDSDVRVKSMMQGLFSTRIKETEVYREQSQEEYEELDRIFSGCNALSIV